MRFVLAIGLPLLAMALWGLLRVPNDPGNAPLPVPVMIRLALELVEFGVAAWLLIAAGRLLLGIGLAVIVALHYAISYDRSNYSPGALPATIDLTPWPRFARPFRREAPGRAPGGGEVSSY